MQLSVERRPPASWRTLWLQFVSLSFAASAISAQVVFPDAFDGKPLATPLREGEPETPALRDFKASGVNAYNQSDLARQEGQALYEHWCQVCHNPDGKGKLGPSLLGPAYTYQQTASDPGMFAVIYGGASGAMQPFSRRDITQDEILKVMAYVRALPK